MFSGDVFWCFQLQPGPVTVRSGCSFGQRPELCWPAGGQEPTEIAWVCQGGMFSEPLGVFPKEITQEQNCVFYGSMFLREMQIET